MTVILPCPCCGARAEFIKRSVGIRGTVGGDEWYSIRCTSCRLTIGADDNRFRAKSDALAAWNRRGIIYLT